MLVVGVAGDEVPAGTRPLVSTPWIWSKGWMGLVVARAWRAVALGFGWAWCSADLDQVGVAVEAEGSAACGGDVLGVQAGSVEEGDVGVADGLEAGEAVWIWARSGLLAASSDWVRVRVMAMRCFWGTPGMLAPGASGSGVMVMEWTRPRSTMLQGRTGS